MFVESQSWWLTTPGQNGTDFGHVHIGACLPSEQRVSGVVHIDIRVIVHDGQGAVFDRIEPVIKTDAIETTLASYTGCKGTTIFHGTITCWQGVDVDTTRYDVDGRNELRLRAWSRTPDGNHIHVSLNTLWDVRNGKTVNAMDRLPFQRGKGWYTDHGYCEADVTTPVTPAAVSGVWSPKVRIVNHADSDVVTGSSARLDPDFHAEPPLPGTVLFEHAGQHPEATLSVDTTKLANGPHRLVLRADCETAEGSTNSGVLVVFFRVQN